jgi:hypothetical protein
MTEEPWQIIDTEVARAFETGEILSASRKKLESWLAALSGQSYQYMTRQTPMLQRLEVIKHLVSVRLTEESQQRRDAQAAEASKEMRRHNRLTRWLAVAGILVTAAVAIANHFWPPPVISPSAPTSAIAKPMSLPSPSPAP